MPAKPPRPMPGWARALLQSCLVAVYIMLSFLAVYRFHSKLAMASLAASAFIAFGFPGAESARTKYFIGGYLCGIVCGAACCLLLRLVPPVAAAQPVVLIAFCALAVFLTSLAMFLLNLQHPPAVAMALSMVLEDKPLAMGLTLMLCIVALCVLRYAIIRLLGARLPGMQGAPPQADTPPADPSAG